MKAYCINLPDRPERWERFLINKFPFNVQKVNAIKKSPGWQGCRDSFFMLFKNITEFPCVIFEDDCQMLSDWNEVERIMQQLPRNWDMLHLGATLNEQLEKYSDNLYKIKNAYTLHAVIYNNRKVFDYVLENRNDIRKIDVFITQKVHEKFNCFVTYPMLATQRPGHSDIVNKYTDYKELNDSYRRFTR